MVGASTCGDVMKLDLKLDIDDKITDVKFKTYGCGSAIASSSLFVDMLIGKTVEEAKQIKDKEIAENIELHQLKFIVVYLQKKQYQKQLNIGKRKLHIGDIIPINS